MKISDFLNENLVFSDLQSTEKAETIRELATLIAGRIPALRADDLTLAFSERERLGSTAVGRGIAIPHGKLDVPNGLTGCLARSRKGVAYDSLDGQPTHLFFALVGPQSSATEHLEALARISRLFRTPDLFVRMMDAESTGDLYRIVVEEDRG
ncbi:MAG TPA: PTS sugar transporter subunit IIA [Thermoanaerobaculia bacterium]